ncbi:MAG: deoxyhypusine synthase family protein, partial [Candidatus Anstonellaceae archaeon]
MNEKPISVFMEENFKHFNARELLDAAKSYKKFIENNGKMLITIAGALSTAEIGISLAEMIRQNKVHAISCTGANLEEDIFNLVAHNHYRNIPKYRYFRQEDDYNLFLENYN